MTEVSEWANEGMSTAESASEASSGKQANKWAVQANERTSKWPRTHIPNPGLSEPQCAVEVSNTNLVIDIGWLWEKYLKKS